MERWPGRWFPHAPSPWPFEGQLPCVKLLAHVLVEGGSTLTEWSRGEDAANGSRIRKSRTLIGCTNINTSTQIASWRLRRLKHHTCVTWRRIRQPTGGISPTTYTGLRKNTVHSTKGGVMKWIACLLIYRKIRVQHRQGTWNVFKIYKFKVTNCYTRKS